MLSVSTCPRLLAFCPDYLIVAICTMFGCFLLCGVVTAAPGQLDPTFGTSGLATYSLATGGNDYAHAVIVQSDRKILVAGHCFNNGNIDFCLARYDSNGSKDSAFGLNGTVLTPFGVGTDMPYSVLEQADHKILVAGGCTYDVTSRFCLVRYLPNGLLDVSFGQVGKLVLSMAFGSGYQIDERATAVALTSDGLILVAGNCLIAGKGFGDLCVARLYNDGRNDPNFGEGGRKFISVGDRSTDLSRMVVQPDGRIVFGGTCYVGSQRMFCAIRLLSDGRLDISFGGAGRVLTPVSGVIDAAYALALQSDGKIVLAGNCDVSGNDQACVVRYKPSGELDATFGIGGKVTTVRVGITSISQVLIDSAGSITLTGTCATTGQQVFCASRYRPDGSIDTTFADAGRAWIPIGIWEYSGPVAGSWDAATQGDEKLVLVGYCLDGGEFKFCLARIKGGPQDPLLCALNVDANQTIGLTTDALLITRYLLGLRGDALTTGAIGQNPTRTGQALEDHLASLNLDADGDGQALAMTDGLLMLRAMLGLTGDALTAGATNTAHPNVRNAQQILTWIEQTHGVACLP
jgi:uncharacterized delta-60 repeat protein